MAIENSFRQKIFGKPLLLAVYLGTLIMLSIALSEPYRYQSLGTFDFIQYWSAHSLLREYQNPYSISAMLVRQKEVGLDLDIPVMFWVPPWTATLLSPVLVADFYNSARIWALTNCGLFALSCVLCWLARVRRRNALLAPALGLTLAFPVWNCIRIGQIGLLLALGTSGLYWALCRKHWYAAGAFLCLLTLKPHLFLVLGVAFLWWSVRQREWRPLVGFSAVFLLLLAVTETMFPGSLSLWIESVGRKEGEGVPTIYNWVPATVVGFLKNVLADERGMVPAWPMVVVPGVAVVMLLFFLVRTRPKIDWSRDFSPLLAASMFLAPYGWCPDFAALLPGAFFLMIASESEGGRVDGRGGAGVVAISCAAFVMMLTGFNMQHHYFWIPLAMFVLLARKAWKDPILAL